LPGISQAAQMARGLVLKMRIVIASALPNKKDKWKLTPQP
jgi:hypothetical protein